MKIRNGFVSNSSSSSFVIIASKKLVKEALETLTDFGRDVVDDLAGSGEEVKLDGKTFVLFSGIESSEEFASSAIEKRAEAEAEAKGVHISDFDYDSYDYYEEAQEQWSKFSSYISKNGGVSKSQGC